MSNREFLSSQQRELLNRVLAQKGIQTLSEREGTIPVRPDAETAPLSFSQQRLWILDRLQPGLAAYNVPAAFRLEGRVDLEALQRSFDAVLRRHRVLTARLEEREGRPVQRLRSVASTTIPVVDLSALEEPGREAEAFRLVRDEARRPFDLAEDLLIRPRIVRLRPEDHVFILTLHHIVSDAWSIRIFMQEMATLYEARVDGREIRLPELPIQYTDYAEWQRDQAREEALEEQLGYWEQQLAGDPPPLALPVDRERGPVQTFRGATETFSIDPGTAAGLAELGREHGATPFMVLLAAFDVLLHRFTGDRDLRIGTPVAGRGRRELESLIGFFVNTLVLRNRVETDAAFEDLVLEVKRTALEGFEHQDVPFEHLVERLEPRRIRNRTPLFQTMFALENVPESRIEVSDMVLRRLRLHNGTAKFDLTLFMTEVGDRILGTFEYNERLFDRATVRRLASHFRTLLGSIARTPSAPVGRLEIFAPHERHQVLEEWQGARAPEPAELAHEALRRRAAEEPGAVALRVPGGEWTFGELVARVGRVASALRGAGIGPESRVGIFLERSAEMVAAVWGVLAAGGAYVPLDPAAPSRRTAFQAEDSGVEAFLTLENLAPHLPAGEVPVIAMDDGGSALPEGRPDALPATVDPDHLAYVIYTSGSTGLPKGVEVTHRGLADYLFNWCLPAYRVAEGGGAPLHTSLGFDLTVTGLLAPLVAGRPVTILPREPAVEDLARALRDGADFSLVKLTPAHLDLLNRLLDEEGVRGSTRALVLGGEALPARSVAAWKRRNAATRVFNEYGPTETVVGCCVHESTPDDLDGGTVPIGRPTTNTRLYLLDDGLEPVPVGAVGEIFLGGAGVARGYAARPGLTADRFLPDPHGPVGERLYRTGDRARAAHDGRLTFLGRVDDQVKLRGYRIEPGEVEDSLRRHPAVEDAVVTPATGGDHLVAYVVPSGGVRPEVTDLQAHLREWLPEYMVPAAWTLLDSFPLTPNGKVDRPALAEVGRPRVTSSARFVAPRTPTEEIVAAIWSEVLGVDRVGAESDFFELGGHSMVALEMVFRVREALGADLALHEVFEASTVSDLGKRIDGGAGENATGPPLERADRSRPLPLSFAQQRLWFLHKLAPDDATYNIAYPLRLAGDLRIDVLGRALDAIVERHEVLRTTYPTVGGEPRQRIHPELGMPLHVEDLRNRDDPETVAAEAVRAEMREPFDLAEGPLFRVRLFRTGAREHFGVLVLHHIVSDAWSTELLVRELVTLYDALSRGKASPLAELPFQYADFAVWQRRRLTPETLDSLLAYWKEQLGASPPKLELPTDRPRRVRSDVEGRVHGHTFRAGTRDALRRIARDHGVTPFMAALAAFQVLLGRYAGQDELVVGTPVAERGDRGLEDVIGLFLNMLPIRADLGGEPTLAAVLDRVRRTAGDAFAHQELPFERLVEAYQSDRDLARTPLFQVLFTYQQAPSAAFELPGLRIRSLDVDARTARFDITLFVVDTGDSLEARFEYAADLFDATTIARMARHLEAVLKVMDREPELPIGRIPLLGSAEMHLLVREWNATGRCVPFDRCLHTLIAERVRENPEAPAVELTSERLTYGELYDRASRLARYLRSRGVGPETPVGICVERSAEMMVGILGILEAGGAYVPLDPVYPVGRLAYMVEDSGARMVLTQERLLARLPEGGPERLCLDSQWEERIAPLPSEPVVNRSSPDDLAYVIYTSGSTGKPKGTMVSHRSVINHGLAMGEVYGLDRSSRVSQFFSLSFDGSVEDLFPPLLVGAALLLHPDPTRSTLQEVMDFHRERKLSMMHLPTAFWHHFAGQLHDGTVELPPTVERTSAGGEALAMDKLRDYLEDTGGDVPFVNVYGPTEATVTASTLEARAGEWDDYPGGSLPIGRPLPNVTLHVVDAAMRSVPLGVPGELLIGGVGVARGYLGRPGLTAERFVPDPFAADGSRLYRTGDLARHLPDGTLEYRGRIDGQVKIRSFRVELAEIESALGDHPAVSEVVVAVKSHGEREDDRRIVAYVVPEGEMPETPAIRAHLERFLPGYMIPSAVVPLERLPLTPNGKIDRAALPAPRYEEQSSRAFVPPRTPEEKTIAEIWKAVLGLDRVGVEDNFFEVGGHSLLAVRVHERLQQELRREIPLIRLFEHGTVAGLARFLSREAEESAATASLERSDEWAERRRSALRRQRAARAGRNRGVTR